MVDTMSDSMILTVNTNWSYVVPTNNSEQIVLYSIRRWMFIILPLFIYVLGIPGNILGVIVFRTQAMRENFLSKFFVCVCTNNIFCLIWGLSRHSVEGFLNWNYRLHSLQICFVHSYVLIVQMSFGNWLLVVISGYRAFFIANPDRFSRTLTLTQTLVSIATCWLVCASLQAVLFFSSRWIEMDERTRKLYRCEISKGGITGALSMSIFAFVPGMLLFFCNTYMYLHHNSHIPQSMATRWTNIKVRNQLFRMVVLSNILFLATNIPLALFYSAFSVLFDLTSAVNLARAKLGLGISAMLFYIGQSMNVVLYCVYGSIFRRELKRIVRPYCPDLCQEIVAQEEEISNISEMSSKQKDFIAEVDKDIELSEVDADDDIDENFHDYQSTNEPPESFLSITRFSVPMIGSSIAEPIGSVASKQIKT